jgi:hypothetical protein
MSSGVTWSEELENLAHSPDSRLFGEAQGRDQLFRPREKNLLIIVALECCLGEGFNQKTSFRLVVRLIK